MIRSRDVDSVVAALGQVPWLSRLGAPIDPDEPPLRFRFTHLIRDSGWLRRRTREAIYTRVRNRVIELAAKNVPYDPERDPWYAPNAAVLTAGSVAGLMAVYRLIGEWPDTAIERLWQWYRCGHWPAAYDDEEFPIVF